jgi:hypothetical protein
VAPPADFLSSSLPSSGPPDEAGALLMILDLAASLTGSLRPVVSDKDRALVFQILSLASQLTQVTRSYLNQL